MRGLAVFLMALLLLGCTGTAHVTTPLVAHKSQKIAGNYAVHIQSGGWQLKTNPVDASCSLWRFNTPVDESYVKAMQTVLTETLQSVDFRPDIQDTHTLKRNGYDAQISLVQGPAASQFGISPNSFGAGTDSDVELTLHIAILYPDGQRQQQSVTGKASKDGFKVICSSIADIIADAAREAVRDVVSQAVDSIDNQLEIRRRQVTTRG